MRLARLGMKDNQLVHWTNQLRYVEAIREAKEELLFAPFGNRAKVSPRWRVDDEVDEV